MRRSLAVILVLAIVVPALGCGAVSINGMVNFGTISGLVSIVHVTVINGNVTVTAVTLVNNNASNTQNFCGNVASQFPMNSFVTATFNPGTTCGTIITVVISG